MENDKPQTVSSKISAVLYKAMKETINRKGYLNESDFIRDAIKDKIEKEAA